MPRADRLEWRHASVEEVPPDRFDVIYLYRPLRPVGPGRAFYEWFARAAGAADGPLAIVSVADCLKHFLPLEFRVLHDDGQVTVFSNHGGEALA